MLKKIMAALLALSLLISCQAALASPVRDMQVMEVEPDSALRSLVSLYAGASLLRDVPSLAEGETPSQALVEGVMLLGLYRIVLPRVDENPLDDVETVPEDVLSTYYNELFVTGGFVMPDAPICPCITRHGDKLSFDFDQLKGDEAVGAYIYRVTQDGDRLKVYADVYTTASFFGDSAENIPEDSLVWENQMILTLEKSKTSQFGYRLAEFTTSQGYLDGALSEWQIAGGAQAGYTAVIPSIFESQGDGLYRTADNAASLKFTTVQDARAEKLDYYLSLYQKAHEGATLNVEADLGYFTGEIEGKYTLCIALESTGTVYNVELFFPAERQAEFTFYGEMIRNSFSGEGLADG